jgi:thymidylate kinase
MELGKVTFQNELGVQAPRVISFSGVDCSGKSTQISVVIDKMRQRGQRPIYLWLRVGYTPLFSALKNVGRRLLGRERLPQGQSVRRERFMSSGWKRSLWLHLAFADMALQTAILIRLLPLFRYSVLCDRYIEESEMDLLLNFGDQAARLPAWRFVKAIAAKPDVRILFDLPFEESLKRSILKQEPFPDPEEKRRRRAALYEMLKQQNMYHIIDARMSITAISAVIDSLILGGCAPAKGTTEVLT